MDVELIATPHAGQLARDALRRAFPNTVDWRVHASLLGVVSELVAHRATTVPQSVLALHVELGADGRFRGTLDHPADETPPSLIALALLDGLSESWGRSPGIGRTWFVIAEPAVQPQDR